MIRPHSAATRPLTTARAAISVLNARLPRRPLPLLALTLAIAAVVGSTALLTRPAPAAAARASQVLVRAHGTSGAEQVALRINGDEVSRWTVSTSPDDYIFTTDTEIEIGSVEVAFVNDNGVERDLIVDHIDVGGIILESEDPSTTSTGTFLSGEGCRERSSISETLHCRGSFSYDVPDSAPADASDAANQQPDAETPANVETSVPPTSQQIADTTEQSEPPAPVLITPDPQPATAATNISTRVFGATGSERIELRINAETVMSTRLAQGWQLVEHRLVEAVAITGAEVHFINDDGPRDVRVDFLEVDGERFESEDQRTRARGTWVSGRCSEGASSAEWLRCNGWFRYDVNNTAAVIPNPDEDAEPAEAPSTIAAPVTVSPTAVPPTAVPPTAVPPTVQEPESEPARLVGGPAVSSGARYSISDVIDGTIGAGDGSNPNEESPMGRHDAPLALNQGWNWAQGPTRNSVWGQLGSGNSRYAEFRCAVIPELGHTPSVPFRINVREAAYYQFVNGDWQKGFDVDLTGGNHGGYLGTAGGSNNNPFTSGSHGRIDWRREADGSFSAAWNPSALMMHFWASKRQAPAPGQTAEFLTSEVRLQQPDGQTVDLSTVRVLFQCGIDYYNTTGGQGTQVPGPGIAKYHRATEAWSPGLWVTLPRSAPANSVSDFATWLRANTPPNVG